MVISFSEPQVLQGSTLKEMQSRITTGFLCQEQMKRDVIKSLVSGNMAPSSDTVMEDIQVSCCKEMSPHLESYPGFKGQVYFCSYRCHKDGV